MAAGKEFDEKRTFVHAMRYALRLDPRSEVRDIELIKDEERAMEIIIILFRGGQTVWINTTRNSNGANAMEIMREVYGSGAFARMKGGR